MTRLELLKVSHSIWKKKKKKKKIHSQNLSILVYKRSLNLWLTWKLWKPWIRNFQIIFHWINLKIPWKKYNFCWWWWKIEFECLFLPHCSISPVLVTSFRQCSARVSLNIINNNTWLLINSNYSLNKKNHHLIPIFFSKYCEKNIAFLFSSYFWTKFSCDKNN